MTETKRFEMILRDGDGNHVETQCLKSGTDAASLAAEFISDQAEAELGGSVYLECVTIAKATGKGANS